MNINFIIDHPIFLSEKNLPEDENYIPNPNTLKCGICGQIQSRSVRCIVCSANLLVTFDNNNGNVYLQQRDF